MCLGNVSEKNPKTQANTRDRGKAPCIGQVSRLSFNETIGLPGEVSSGKNKTASQHHGDEFVQESHLLPIFTGPGRNPADTHTYK